MKYFTLCSLALFLTLYTHAQSVPSYVPTNGLVGWWPFNGNANDESGNGLNGTFVNGAYLSSPYNQSASFNGINSLLSIPSNPGFNKDTFSISIRIKMNVSPYHNPIQFGIINGAMRWSIGFQTNQIYYSPMTCAGGWGASANSLTSATLNTSTWYHIIWTTEGTRTKFYLDGTLAGDINTAAATTCWDQNMKWYLGGDIGGGAIEYYSGEMDELGFWSRMLTQQEVTSLYNASTPTTSCPAIPSNLQSGLVGYWPFCGNANDISGNGNNGTVNGPSLTADRFGQSNSSYLFNGNGNYIGVNSNNLPVSERTISIWFKANSLSGGPGLLGYGGNSCGNSFILLMNQAVRPNRIINQGHCLVDTLTSAYPTSILNTWNHLIVTTSSSGTKHFLNGIQVSSNTTYINSTYIVNRGLSIGSIVSPNGAMPYVDPNCTWWNGALDDIAIWNRALSSNEIAQLYAAQSTPSGGSGSTSSASGSFPSGIPFQAVVRDSTGQPISNQPLTVRFSILDSAGYTSALYTETHSVTTNPLGLFTAVVGNGTASGTPFDSLSWDGSGKYLKVEIDRGTGYSTLITQPMQSVPYAIRARSADKISNQYLPVYLNNAAALAAGLHPGDMYRTPTGVLMVVY